MIICRTRRIILALSLLLVLLIITTSVQAACRSASVKHRFDVAHGYPKGRPSLPGEEKWIVDHWCALECGGIDDVSNLVYQQYTESKKKDLIERKRCDMYCNVNNSTPTRKVFNCVN